MKRSFIGLTIPLAVAVALTGCMLRAARYGDIAGSLIDEWGDPIVDAQLQIDGSTSYTDGQGRFSFTDVEYGVHTLSVMHQGALIQRQVVRLDRPRVAIEVEAFAPEPCTEGDAPPAGMVLVFCENFQGLGATTPQDLGWIPHGAGADQWVIERIDQKNWATSPSSGTSRVAMSIPELAGADRVVVEMTTMHDAQAAPIWALNFLANAYPGTDRTGGTAFLATLYTSGLNMRQYKQGAQLSLWQTFYSPAAGEPDTYRFIYDHQDLTLEVYRNDTLLSGYPRDLAEGIQGPDHTYIVLSPSNTLARWTDIRVWVD